MGLPAFRPGQERLIRAVLAGKDALGILPTGGGKSVCFQLPAFLLEGTVVVVSPLISLMEDQLGRARALGLEAHALSAALPSSLRKRIIADARDGGIDLLFLSPERLHLPEFSSAIPHIPFSLVAIDEAHCISLWGQDFRPAYLRIGKIRSRLKVPFLALTATATPRVREEIRQRLRLRNPVSVVGSFDRPNLVWSVGSASSPKEKVGQIRRALREREGASIVYTSTRKTVEGVTRALTSRGLPAMGYHAGLPPSVRSRIQGHFLKDPSPIVVATNAFGMGIDRPDVRLVLHYQIPGSLEAYYQEAGRAGRDGREAWCLALFGNRDRFIHDRFIAMSHPPTKVLEEALRTLMNRFDLHQENMVPEEDLKHLLAGKTTPYEGLAILQALVRCRALLLGELPPSPGSDSLARMNSPTDLGSSMRGEHGKRYSLTLVSSSLRAGPYSRHRSAREAQMEAVMNYAQARGCRRSVLLGYFGEAGGPGGCGKCDRCLSERGRSRAGISSLLRLGAFPGLFGKGGRT